jgi:cAMP-binding proteins - catabolite gene activator and regulatory subunit of cAMP-dependent protein kinases
VANRCDTDLLAQVPLFSELSRAELARIAAVAKPVKYPDGATVVEEGSLGGRFFVIQSGSAKVQTGGRTRVTLGPGSYFGELSVLDGQPRSASVVASSALETWSIAEFNFRALVKQHPALAVKLLSVLSARLRAAERSLVS